MATEADLRAFCAESGRNWDGLCQALIWNWCNTYGHAPVAYASALEASYASTPAGSGWHTPVGGFCFLDIGSYGHVTVRVDNGRDGMASSRVTEFWSLNAGEVTLADYVAATGAEPMFWAATDGANDFNFEPQAGPLPEPEPEEEDMKYIQLVTASGDGRNRRLFAAPGTAWYLEIVEAGSELGSALGKVLETGSSIGTSQSVIDATKAAGDRVNDRDVDAVIGVA